MGSSCPGYVPPVETASHRTENEGRGQRAKCVRKTRSNVQHQYMRNKAPPQHIQIHIQDRNDTHNVRRWETGHQKHTNTCHLMLDRQIKETRTNETQQLQNTFCMDNPLLQGFICASRSGLYSQTLNYQHKVWSTLELIQQLHTIKKSK